MTRDNFKALAQEERCANCDHLKAIHSTVMTLDRLPCLFELHDGSLVGCACMNFISEKESQSRKALLKEVPTRQEIIKEFGCCIAEFEAHLLNAGLVCTDLQGYKNFVVKLENESEEAKPAATIQGKAESDDR